MIFIRKLHKWLGLIVAAQLFIWVLSGSLISLIDARKVSGQLTMKQSVPTEIRIANSDLLPVADLPVDFSQVEAVKLLSMFSQPLYRLQQTTGVSVFDAVTGLRYEVDQETAETLARLSYKGDGQIEHTVFLPSGSHEMRKAHGPLWQINFADELSTRAYVSAVDGTVLAHRNERWVVVDFLLMLHFMDYFRNDSFNNPQIIVLGFGTLWLAISGVLLILSSFSRKDFIWILGNSGSTTTVIVESKAGQNQSEQVDSALSLYAGLSQRGVQLPSNCDGVGSCGMCRVSFQGQAPTPTGVDKEWLSERAIANGERLACQHKPSNGQCIQVPEMAFQSELLQGEVVESKWLTPLLKQIRVRPDKPVSYRPGDYFQFQILPGEYSLTNLNVPLAYRDAWGGFSLPLKWKNEETLFRAYSVATAPDLDETLEFTIRFSPPPKDSTDLPPGYGSSALCSFVDGTRVAFRGPSGDFHLVDSECEKILIGGGAGMAPLKSMTMHLLETKNWNGTLRFWFGARNQNEILFREQFESLAARFENFEWGVALSDADNDPMWSGPRGFIHHVVEEHVLRSHPGLYNCEFYLCGPPLMLEATRHMLKELGVSDDRVFFDDFGS